MFVAWKGSRHPMTGVGVKRDLVDVARTSRPASSAGQLPRGMGLASALAASVSAAMVLLNFMLLDRLD